MVPTEVLKKVRRIQIITSAVVNDVFAGQYHSAFKGRGMEFEEVREYQPGDDVRTIDWNVTARAGRPFIKSYREERELTVMLVVDVSASQDFGTREQLKSELVAELGATLALSAIQNNDKVGLLLFTDRIERFVPARKGARHVLRVVRELLYRDPAEAPAYVPRPHERPDGRSPTGRGTDVSLALRYLERVLTRRSVVFLISDFQTGDFSGPLRIVRHRHDLIPIFVSDVRERELPRVRYLELLDPETGEQVLVDTSTRAFRRRFSALVEQRRTRLTAEFHKLGIDTIAVATGEPFVMPLTRFFRRRERRR
ncbi:hypothetical protein RAS1_35710 [Phycisphaerae bacterium RAS1]|nr:hypothetical protein RAS1_35710 [Phycisphaerae bacterium RAS1]